MVHRSGIALGAALVASLAIGACGGSGGGGATSAATAPASIPRASAPTTTPQQAGPIERIRSRLQRAGYDATENDATGTPKPIGGLDVPLGRAQVAIYVFRSSGDLGKAAAQLLELAGEHPRQTRVRVEDDTIHAVYVGTIQEPAKLPVAKFNKVVAAAEGR